MKLDDLITELAYGELANSNCIVDDGNKIKDAHMPKVINAINNAVNYLHTVFNLRFESVIIPLKSFQQDYEIPEDDFRILQILNTSPIDAVRGTYSTDFSEKDFFVCGQNMVRVSKAVLRRIKMMTVRLKVCPVPIPLLSTDMKNIEVEVPYSLIPLLKLCVAEALLTTTGDQSSIGISQMIIQQKMALMEDLKHLNIGYSSMAFQSENYLESGLP